MPQDGVHCARGKGRPCGLKPETVCFTPGAADRLGVGGSGSPDDLVVWCYAGVGRLSAQTTAPRRVPVAGVVCPSTGDTGALEWNSRCCGRLAGVTSLLVRVHGRNPRVVVTGPASPGGDVRGSAGLGMSSIQDGRCIGSELRLNRSLGQAVP
jgi:hypothetical protein